MTTLIDRIDTLCTIAEKQVTLEGGQAESSRLQHLLKDVRRLMVDIEATVDRLRLFHDQAIAVASPDKAETALKNLRKLRDRFDSQRRAEELTKGKGWSLLNDQVSATSTELSSSLAARWRDFLDSAYTGAKPKDLERTLAGTPKNKQNLERYKRVYGELEVLRRSPPGDRSDFQEVRELARQLSEINQDFDYDVPEAVSKFLRAVGDGGADLDLLTDSVREWLRAHQTLSQYRVVARTRSL